jgi:flagellar motility protein MotE (MotC chaperone)
MSATVRVLPALIAVSIGALAFKGVDVAQAFAEANEAADQATSAKPETQLTSGIADAAFQKAGAPPEAGGEDAAKCIPAIDYASETGISEQEVLVLRSLSDRRQALDEREAGLETREQMAAAAEVRLDDQISKLKSLEGDVQKLLAAMEAKRDERMVALVKTYEAMKAKDAARIFDGMDDKVLLELAKSMKPANLAAVLAAMDSKRAESLTRMLASLAQPPQSLDELQKSEG